LPRTGITLKRVHPILFSLLFAFSSKFVIIFLL
jgi:hypothetical protein